MGFDMLSDISMLDRKEQCELKSEEDYEALSTKYNTRRKCLKVVWKDLQHNLVTSKAKFVKYN